MKKPTLTLAQEAALKRLPADYIAGASHRSARDAYCGADGERIDPRTAQALMAKGYARLVPDPKYLHFGTLVRA